MDAAKRWANKGQLAPSPTFLARYNLLCRAVTLPDAYGTPPLHALLGLSKRDFGEEAQGWLTARTLPGTYTIGIRSGPEYPGEHTGGSIETNTVFAYGDKTTVQHTHTDGVQYEIDFFELADGRGWVHTFDPDEPGKKMIAIQPTASYDLSCLWLEGEGADDPLKDCLCSGRDSAGRGMIGAFFAEVVARGPAGSSHVRPCAMKDLLAEPGLERQLFALRGAAAVGQDCALNELVRHMLLAARQAPVPLPILPSFLVLAGACPWVFAGLTRLGPQNKNRA